LSNFSSLAGKSEIKIPGPFLKPLHLTILRRSFSLYSYQRTSGRSLGNFLQNVALSPPHNFSHFSQDFSLVFTPLLSTSLSLPEKPEESESVVRWSPACEDVSPEAEECLTLEAATKQRD
jgi:hypothetical protein